MHNRFLKLSCLLCLSSSLVFNSGCSGNKVLKLYNSFVNAVNSGDYATAYSLTTLQYNPFMTEDAFEDSIFENGDFYTGTKAKKNDLGYDITTPEGIYTVQITNNLLVIDDLVTELELYVPSGSVCTYNGASLDSSFITEDDGIETTYTITAPISIGVLHISTEAFGDSEREVDPFMGDENDFTLSSEMSIDIGDSAIKAIDAINNSITTGDKETIKSELNKYNQDFDYTDKFADKLITNRKIDEPFVSYHDVVFNTKGVEAELSSSTTVDATITFNVNWKVGEDKEASSDVVAIMKLEKTSSSWDVVSIDNYDFLLLNVIEGDGVDEIK